jgi:hypothetical protein
MHAGSSQDANILIKNFLYASAFYTQPQRENQTIDKKMENAKSILISLIHTRERSRAEKPRFPFLVSLPRY